MIRAIITDIEGTTGSIAFVHDVLFPYARAHMSDYLEANALNPAVDEQITLVRQSAGEPQADVARVGEILTQWLDEDREATPLKALQGMIWETGYRQGDFTGHVYEDAVRCLHQWQKQGRALYVYSSGSIHSQKLLFGHSGAGDLTGLFAGHFDTTTGPKREADSYRRIVEALGPPADEILFLSDVVAELDAAAEAGLATVQLVRSASMATGDHRMAATFDEVEVVDA